MQTFLSPPRARAGEVFTEHGVGSNMEPITGHLAGIRSKTEPMVSYPARLGSISETDVLTKHLF
jgi:hypothetical protein